MTCLRPPRGLYAITPDEPDTARLLRLADDVLRGGAVWLQYRNKSAGSSLRREQTSALKPLCQSHGAALILNDDWRLAAELGVDGAHLGEDDASIATVRDAVGPAMLLGASCYDSLERARAAVAAGASYIAFGAFFASPTKPHARVAAPSLLRESSTLGVPRVAIGGITADNAAPLIAEGADLVAVISGVFSAPDPFAASQRIASYFTSTQSPGTE